MECSRCGKSQTNDAIFCGACGAPLMRDESVEPAPPKRYRPAPQEKRALGSAEAREEDLKAPGYTVFSPSGRLNRLKYLYFVLNYYLAITLMTVGLVLSVGGSITSVSDSLNGPALMLALASAPVSLMLLAVCVITMIKRFHDIDEPGWHYFLLLIPFYNIYVSFKLFLKDSVADSSDYGARERVSWYWQLPLTLLTLPVAFAVVGGVLFAGNLPELAAAAQAQSQPQHYYSEQYRVSIDFPARWTVQDQEGFVKTATSPDGMQGMFLNVGPIEEEAFEDFSPDELDAVVAAFNDPAQFAKQFALDSSLVSDLSCVTKDIGGKRFLLMDAGYPLEEKPYRYIFLLGNHDGQRYAIQMFLPADAEAAALSEMMASAESLLVGDEAKAATSTVE